MVQARMMPTMMGHQVFGGSKVNIAACGSEHTVITTTDGEVWTWGLGIFGRLGHGDDANKLLPTLVGKESFGSAKIVTVAAGSLHSMALTEAGEVWNWGSGYYARLGHKDQRDRLSPTLLPRQCLAGQVVRTLWLGLKHPPQINALN